MELISSVVGVVAAASCCGILNCLSGLPRSGKGVYTVLQFEEELQRTERHIITNFAIELKPWLRKLAHRRSRGEKGFLAYLYDKYGETFDAEKRIHMLNMEQLKEFFLWRVGLDGKLFEVECERDRSGKVVSLKEDVFANTLPCVYFLDEAWATMYSHDVMQAPRGLTFYAAQHGKAGDDAWITCQHTAQLNKQVKILFECYHSCVNHKFRKILWFNQPNRISVVVSNEPPDQRSKLANLPKIIKFDTVGVGGSFDTARGAGVQGNGADIEKKQRGLPWWGIIVLIAVLGASILGCSQLAGRVTGHLLTPQRKDKNQVVGGGGGTNSAEFKSLFAATVKLAAEVERLRRVEFAVTNRAAVTNQEPEVYMTGLSILDGRGRVFLSDGRVVMKETGLEQVGKDFCIVKGKKYVMH